MQLKKFHKYICCTMDLTIGTRVIGFIGIMISILLVTVLLNDKYFTKEINYDVSRKTALALGLDWQHFHSQASIASHKDTEGKTVTTIVTFYAIAFLVLNLLLCFATIKHDWRCAVPWLVCELFGCLSKLGALIYHFYYDQQNLNAIFVTGSIVYIVTIIWLWTVVLLALLSWRTKRETVSTLELSKISSHSSELQQDVPGKIRYFEEIINNTGNLDSPGPYSPNRMNLMRQRFRKA